MNKSVARDWMGSFFFCCIAELAIKPCRSSRSKLRGEFGIPNTCKTGNKNTTKQQTPPNQKHNTKQKTGKCLECETRGEKRVKRPKRPNALICRTVKTTLERCGPFSLVVLSQRRSQVTPLSGHSDQNASETFSNKLQLNKVQSSLRQTSAKTTQVRSKAKTS